MRRPVRAPLAALTASLLAAGVLATGCAGGGSRPRPRDGQTARTPIVDPPPSSATLTDARLAFESARAAALRSAAAFGPGAAALDAVDAAAVRGDLEVARRGVAASARPATTAAAAKRALPRQAESYASAARGLGRAARLPVLSPPQAVALRDLAAAASMEVAALQGLAASQATGWSAYSDLQQAQALWLQRATDGFYPDQRTQAYSPAVAGNAYTVLVNPSRGALDRERIALARDTAVVQRAGAATAAGLGRAQTAFG